MMLHGNGGFGYVRVDWFTPAAWGRGATGGCSSSAPKAISNFANTSTSQGGRAAIICSWSTKGDALHGLQQVHLPFGPQFVADIVDRTHVAQDQEQALLATELVLKAQKNAKLPVSV